MGYCIPCFGASKHRRKSIRKTHVLVPSNQRLGTCESQQPTKATRQEVKKKIENFSRRQGICETQLPIKATKQGVEKKIEPIVDSKNKQEEQSDGVLVIKKVTFDLNVKPHEEFPTNQIKNPSLELEKDKENGNKKEATKNESQRQSDSSMSSVFTYPPNHRYHDCTRSDDDEGESEAIKSTESDSDDNDNEESESLFSISLESRHQVSAPEIDEKEVNSPIPVRCSPENGLKSIGLNQNERSKSAKTMQLKDPEKENTNININLEEVMAIPFSEELHLKSLNRVKSQIDDVAVDTSLSSWLVESETTSIPKNSPNDSVGNSPGMAKSSRSCKGRQILGALTVEELR